MNHKTDTPQEESLFQLHNGKRILEERLSEKMQIIVDAQPEITLQKDGLAYTWDESGLSELFAECYNEEHRYCPERKSWYSYDGCRWVRDIGATLVSRHIIEFSRLLILYCGEIANEEVRAKYFAFVNKIGNRRLRDNLLRDAAVNELLVVNAEEFDKNPYLLNCLNGTFDLEKRLFRENDWRDFITMRTNCNYTLQKVSCLRWEQFISEICSKDRDGKTPDPEKAEYLQKALGYSLFGAAPEECMFIMYGSSTRNGKGTLQETIRVLLGDYAETASAQMICSKSFTKDAEAPSPKLASLKGKRFITMSESDEAGKLDEGLVKQLTGGDPISARALHQDPITYVPQFTMWLSCNDLPAVKDKSVFASDRLRVIAFNRHFNEDERDETLKTFFKEPENQVGILAWLIEGYYKYRRDGLKMTDSMRSVVKKYEKDNDLILQFLEQKCERTEEGWITAKSLYDAYKIWCHSNGYKPCSAKKFNAGVATHPDWYTDNTRRQHNYPVYDGLKLAGN